MKEEVSEKVTIDMQMESKCKMWMASGMYHATTHNKSIAPMNNDEVLTLW